MEGAILTVYNEIQLNLTTNQFETILTNINKNNRGRGFSKGYRQGKILPYLNQRLAGNKQYLDMMADAWRAIQNKKQEGA